jgi:Fe-S cluster assembly protein SufD
LAPGPFGDVNTSLFQDGLLVRVGKGVSVTVPIRLDLDGPSQGALAIHPRILIVAEEASSVCIVERYSGRGGTLTNAVTEVVVGPGASVEHVQVRRPRATGMHVGSLAVRVERDGAYSSRVVAVGGRLSRLDLHVDLAGKGASCELDGLYVVAADEHVNHHTVIDHSEPHTTSAETYKGIIAGEAVAVFDGRVRIHKDAQRSSVSQENRNLLMSDAATIHTKPSLIIDADDVTAAHGATVGQLDEDALFYLRSRGIGAAEARSLLIHAFARDVLDKIHPPELAEELLGAVLARLP